jgi:hypothetical protein
MPAGLNPWGGRMHDRRDDRELDLKQSADLALSCSVFLLSPLALPRAIIRRSPPFRTCPRPTLALPVASVLRHLLLSPVLSSPRPLPSTHPSMPRTDRTTPPDDSGKRSLTTRNLDPGVFSFCALDRRKDGGGGMDGGANRPVSISDDGWLRPTSPRAGSKRDEGERRWTLEQEELMAIKRSRRGVPDLGGRQSNRSHGS